MKSLLYTFILSDWLPQLNYTVNVDFFFPMGMNLLRPHRILFRKQRAIMSIDS